MDGFSRRTGVRRRRDDISGCQIDRLRVFWFERNAFPEDGRALDDQTSAVYIYRDGESRCKRIKLVHVSLTVRTGTLTVYIQRGGSGVSSP